MARGRMLTADVSSDPEMGQLSPKAFALYCLVLPHLTNHGKMQAHPATVKGLCAPLFDWLAIDEIPGLLEEVSAHSSLKYFQANGLAYLHDLKWNETQKLRADRLGEDRLPSYAGSTPGVVQEYSGSSPGVVQEYSIPEVEVEVEAEVEVDFEKEEEADTQGEGEGDPRGRGRTELDLLRSAQARLEEKRKASSSEEWIAPF